MARATEGHLEPPGPVARTAEAPRRTSNRAPTSHRARPWLIRAAMLALVLAAALAGRAVARGALYTSGSRLGYSLGVVGGSMVLVLVLYSVRKHVRRLRECGPLKYWFRAHMVCGVVGPVLILLHSTLQARSLNAAVALASMLLVTASGLVGRYIYRRIHHGLYGSRATLKELQDELAKQLAALDPLLTWLPAVRGEVDRFSAVAGANPAGWPRRVRHFLTLGSERRRAARRIRRAMGRRAASRASLAGLLATLEATLAATVQTAQFTTYERLFSLWHVLHVPIVYMLAISAIVHVLAVHMY